MVIVILYMSSDCAIRLDLRRKCAGMRAKHRKAMTIQGVNMWSMNFSRKGSAKLHEDHPNTPRMSRFIF